MDFSGRLKYFFSSLFLFVTAGGGVGVFVVCSGVSATDFVAGDDGAELAASCVGA